MADCAFVTDLAAALAHLRTADPRLTAVIDRHGAPPLTPTRDPFHSLARSIVYQQLTGTGSSQRWVTRLEQSTNGFASVASNDVLSTTPASSAAFVAANNNNLGDYCGLVGIGKTFFGTFSADNTPDNANFPSAVVYQRNANFGTHTLLGTDNATAVGISIDPFFVKVTEAPDEGDVRVTCRTLDETGRISAIGGPLR